MFTLLAYLMRNAGMLLTRRMRLEHVWDINTDPLTNTAEVHILFLRRKLDEGFKRKLV
jgi:DNA-binding response OmpR family regulator